MSRGILLSSIASIDLLFIIFSRKIADYAHIWQRLIIEIVTLPANFSQAPRKWLSFHESSNVECCPSRTQWSGTSMELGLVISSHNTPPGLTRQIAIKLPQSTDLHRWYFTHCGFNALHFYYQHIETGIKWLPFCRHFQCFVLNENCFDHNFTQICSQGPS